MNLLTVDSTDLPNSSSKVVCGSQGDAATYI